MPGARVASVLAVLRDLLDRFGNRNRFGHKRGRWHRRAGKTSPQRGARSSPADLRGRATRGTRPAKPQWTPLNEGWSCSNHAAMAEPAPASAIEPICSLPLVGATTIEDAVFYTAVGAVAFFGVVSWPTAALIGGGPRSISAPGMSSAPASWLRRAQA